MRWTGVPSIQGRMEELLTQRVILIVQDNPVHAGLIEKALGQSSVPHEVVTIADSTEAMEFLHRRGSYASASRPDLMLLDLNLAGKDGKELLAEIKADTQLKRIPIIVLTTSANEADIFNSYALQGNSYVIKSSDVERLAQIVKRIEEFWLGIVTLPIE